MSVAEYVAMCCQKCGLGSPVQFLSCALDPPAWQAISRAMSILHEVGACITEAQGCPVLTALGHHVSLLPVSVRLAKMLVYAAVFGCQEPAVSNRSLLYVSLSSVNNPFSAVALSRIVLQLWVRCEKFKFSTC